MICPVFDTSGNLTDALSDRAAALDCLAGVGQGEPEAAADVFLIAQDNDGNIGREMTFAA